MVFLELFIVTIIFKICVIDFFTNLYKYGMPKFIDWYLIMSFVYIIINYLSIAGDLDNMKNGIAGLYKIKKELIIPSLLCFLLGAITLRTVDYLCRLNQGRSFLPKLKCYKFRNMNVFIGISLIDILIRVILILTGKLGFGSEDFVSGNSSSSSLDFLLSFYNIVSSSIIIIYAIAFFSSYKDSKKLKYSFIIYSILFILVSFLSGSKGGLIFSSIIVAIIFLSSGKKIPIKYAAVFIIILSFLYPVSSELRTQIVKNPFQDRFTLFKEALTAVYLSNENSSSKEMYSDRISMFPYLVESLALEEGWQQYKYMSRYMFLPVSFVPRSFIPGKPKQDIGVEFSKKTIGFDTVATTPTSYGWAFLEGGFLFVVLSFTLLGLALSLFQYYLDRKSPDFFIFYFLLVSNSLLIEPDIYFLLSSLLIMYITIKLFLKLIFENKKKL